MKRSFIAACFLIAPSITACVAAEEDGSIEGGEGGEPVEVAVDEQAPAPAPTQNLFGEACKNTDIFITNSRTRSGVNTAIEVRKVEFYNLTEGKWTSEDLVNAVMNWGDTLVWYNEDLADAEGDVISKWRVYYRYASGGSWSSVVYQEIDTPNETCIADADFEMTVQ